MKFLGCTIGFALVLLIMAVPRAGAAELVYASSAPIFVHLGVSALLSDPKVKVQTLAGRVPAAKVLLPAAVIPSVELGYRLDAHWSASTTVGYPPTVDIKGKGILSHLGRLGSTSLAPLTAGIQYHLTAFGAVQPYLGGGPAYMLVLNSHDASISHLQVRSAWGAFLQGGLDWYLTERTGLFIDIKRAFLDTTFRGRLGPMPVLAKANLNPLMISGGITYRF